MDDSDANESLVAIYLTTTELDELKLYLSWSADMLGEREELHAGLPEVVEQIIDMDHVALVDNDWG